jgi:Domain of unknown function (DUF222)
MPQHPFPEPGPDGEEPDSSPLPPAAEEDGPGQGLYVSVPAGQVTLEGFAQNGEADTMAPGPLLATIVDTVTGQDGAGLAGCSDDQLMGIISGARRLAARAEWTSLAAIREFAARHTGSRPADKFAPDELAFELHLTALSAGGQMAYAGTVAARLPRTFAALGAGRIHALHLRIIEDETRILSDEDAAKADGLLAEAAPGMTFGEVRAAARKLVLKLDPEAVRKRKEAAKREAQVRRFREASGNGGMVARELPSDEVLASWQHVEQRALDLRAAGLPGTLRELRVRAYLDLLQERDSRDQPAVPAPTPAGAEAGEAAVPDQPPPGSEHPGDGPGAADGPSAPDGPSGPGEDGPGRGPDDPAGPDGSDGSGPDGPGGSGPGPGPGGPGNGPHPGNGSHPGAAAGPGPAAGPGLAALVTLTIPWATWQGHSGLRGQADGYGLLDGDDTRDLAVAARHPLVPDHPAPPGTGPPHLKTPLTPVTRGPCGHPHAETGYHPSRKLAHLIRARSATCTAPGCRRPAARCDLDHTIPWDQGGRTCECWLAPRCKR